MNLLPKSHKEFGERDYWNTFFKKRGNKAFEWYGEYLELCGQLHKYIKPKDTILITGCGNSSLSADLYDVGYTNITNIDVSEVAIKQMRSINASREQMKFLCADAMAMPFENEAYHVVLDKGTLDALMPDDSDDVNKNIDRYFSEIRRVLKLGGRFVCISLLQEHILRKLLHWFCDGCWMFRVVRCHEAEAKNSESGDGGSLPVFAVVATKFKKLPQLILEVCMAGDKMMRLKTVKEVTEVVKSVQDVTVVTNGLAKNSLVGQNEVSLDLSRPGETTPRYTIYILDQLRAPPANQYAVFVVPQGREINWLFSTPAGRKQLLASAQFGRLAVATMHRGQHYDSLDAVKEELGEIAKMLAPKGFSGQIPFLSLGSDVGKRIKVFEGTSEFSGDFVVEDVEVEGAMYRRLIFLNNQFLIQSEAKLKTVKSKGVPIEVIDFGLLTSEYHSYMCAGVQLTRTAGLQSKVALIGLGGGGLCSFLLKCFDDVSVTAVDIDEVIYEVAQKYFELTPDKRLDVRIEDGIEFLRREASEGVQYDVVIFDIDSKDYSTSLSCPPKPFLEENVMGDLSKVLSKKGHFILNLVCRETVLHDEIMDSLKKHFQHLASFNIEDEVNEVIFATNSETGYSPDLLDEAAKQVNAMARQKKLVKLKLIDVKNILESLNIQL